MGKKHFALIGHPVSHSVSAFVNNQLFKFSDIDADYDVVDIPPMDLSNAYTLLRRFDGFNVTIPYKQSIISYLDSLSIKASTYNSVNTVKNCENFSKGYTTDPEGLIRALELSEIPLCGKVVVIGAGGAARAAAYEAAIAGCDTIVSVRTESLGHAASLIGDVISSVTAPQISSCTLDALIDNDQSIDLLINATPVGMYPNVDKCVVPESLVKRCKSVFDMIYNPLETKLIKIAKKNGIKCSNGLLMLINQAICAHNIWTGSKFDLSDIRQLIVDTEQKIIDNFKTV